MSNNFGMPFYAEASDTISETKYIPVSTQFSNVPSYYIAQNTQRTFYDTITATIVPNINQPLPAPPFYQPNLQQNYVMPRNVERSPVVLRPTFKHNAGTTTDDLNKAKSPCSCDHLNHCKKCTEFVQNEIKEKLSKTTEQKPVISKIEKNFVLPKAKNLKEIIDNFDSTYTAKSDRWDKLRELLKKENITDQENNVKYFVKVDQPINSPFSTVIEDTQPNKEVLISPKATDDLKYQVFVNELISRDDGDSTILKGESRIEKSSSLEDVKTKGPRGRTDTYTKNKVNFNKIIARKPEKSQKEDESRPMTDSKKYRSTDGKSSPMVDSGKSSKLEKDLTSSKEGKSLGDNKSKSGQSRDGSPPKTSSTNQSDDSSNYSENSTIKYINNRPKDGSNYDKTNTPPPNTSLPKDKTPPKSVSNSKDVSDQPQDESNPKKNVSKNTSYTKRDDSKIPMAKTSNLREGNNSKNDKSSPRANNSNINKNASHPKNATSDNVEDANVPQQSKILKGDVSVTHKNVSFQNDPTDRNSNQPAPLRYEDYPIIITDHSSRNYPQYSRRNDTGHPMGNQTNDGSYFRRDDTGYPIHFGNNTRDDIGRPHTSYRRDDTGYPLFIGNQTRDDYGQPHDGSYNVRNDTGYPSMIGNYTRDDINYNSRKNDTGYPMIGNQTRYDVPHPSDDGRRDDTKHPSIETSYITHDSVYVNKPEDDANTSKLTHIILDNNKSNVTQRDVTIEVGEGGELSFYTEPKKNEEEEDGEKDKTYKNEMFLFINN